MSLRQAKTGFFIIEGLNSFGTVYFFYYLYFYSRRIFGFSDKANLELAAFIGFVCMVAAWQGGKFAQRFGYFRALKLGFGLMFIALSAGLLLHSPAAVIVAAALNAIGMCFTWPTLEALVSEGETPAGLQHNVGVYNVVWAGTAALADFTGGALVDKLGWASLFYVPSALALLQLGLTIYLERSGPDRWVIPLETGAEEHVVSGHRQSANAPAASLELTPRPIARTRIFQRMAWFANPFAYVALNTVVALIPGVAKRLELSTTLAGFCCSVWCFARLGSFFALWLWAGWHYRFRWLLTAYLALAATFGIIVLAPNLAALVTAQLVFGTALGLIYYSSLYYSMDASETKGEHGGIHEAAIGLGNFTGPALGAASLHLFPQYTASGVMAVIALLLCGLGGLLGVWRKGRF